MLQRLPIALAQVKAGNNSKNLLNEIKQANCLFFASVKEKKKKKYAITSLNQYNYKKWTLCL